jgi:hypothetical protein
MSEQAPPRPSPSFQTWAILAVVVFVATAGGLWVANRIEENRDEAKAEAARPAIERTTRVVRRDDETRILGEYERNGWKVVHRAEWATDEVYLALERRRRD